MQIKQSSRLEIISHLKRQAECGQSKTQYCKENKIPSQTFYNWLKKYKHEIEPNKSDFIQIPKPLIEKDTQVEIRLPGGIEIRTHTLNTGAIIKELLQIL